MRRFWSGVIALTVAVSIVIPAWGQEIAIPTESAEHELFLPQLTGAAGATRQVAAAAADATTVIINEVDADTPGTDAAEFVELFDGGAGNTSLDGLVLVFYNGSNDTVYEAFDLDGQSTNASGYFVLCGNAANVANCTLDVSPNTNLLQNGPDAVALLMGDATSFPDGTAVTTTDLVDALVYDVNHADDAGLLVLLNTGEPQVNEDDGTDSADDSNQRCPNGSGGARNTSRYAQFAPTPGAANSCGVDTPPTVTATDPADGAINVDVNTTIAVNFSEAVLLTASAATVECPAGTPITFSGLPAGPASSVILTPDAPLPPGTICTVTVVAAGVTDVDGAADQMVADVMVTFTTLTAATGTVTPYVSDEAPPCLNNNGQATECDTGDPQLLAVDAQDDTWRADLGDLCTFETGTLSAENIAFTMGDVALSRYNVLASDVADPTATGTLETSSGQIVSSGLESMQDDAPKPNSLISAPYWNDSTGSSAGRNAVLFDFGATGIDTGFGAWFGDLETKATRTDYVGVDVANPTQEVGGQPGGTEAFMRLFFANGATQDVPIPAAAAPATRGTDDGDSSTPDWTAAVSLTSGGDASYCGGLTNDANGCGNSTTRWIGFTVDDPANPVLRMLVVVGDDDHNLAGPFGSASELVTCTSSNCDGGTERLSFMGATLASCTTVPVTLSWWHSTATTAGIEFRWQTATETGTAGFNILAETTAGIHQLNGELILSQAIDSLAPLDYRIELATDATLFYLEEVSVDNRQERFGPFALGTVYGSYVTRDPILPEWGLKLYLPLIVQ